MLNELNHVIDYIEDHLSDDLSLAIIPEYTDT
jgi:AraC family transcriptional regulator